MRKLVKVSVSKSVGENDRYLVYNWEFKNEEIADKIIDKMDEKFEEWGYEFRFARCPWNDDGIYGDAIWIPFENGKMSEIKKDMTDMWNEVKSEMGIK